MCTQIYKLRIRVFIISVSPRSPFFVSVFLLNRRRRRRRRVGVVTPETENQSGRPKRYFRARGSVLAAAAYA